MLHIPILRQGKPYESIEKVEIVHRATGVGDVRPYSGFATTVVEGVY